MIPKLFIVEWSKSAPWINNFQVEHDLLIERCLIEIFSDQELREKLAFRGGTALHKLFLRPQIRYSEDIDLVQITNEEIGPVLSKLRKRLSFLGTANYRVAEHNNTLIYRIISEYEALPLKLKIEINTREHFTTFGLNDLPFKVQSQYFTGEAFIRTYQTEEILATKLRALYQRNKGRDLFDLWYAITNIVIDPMKIIVSFQEYLSNEGNSVSSREFMNNLNKKAGDKNFLLDVNGLLRPGTNYNFLNAMEIIKETLISKL